MLQHIDKVYQKLVYNSIHNNSIVISNSHKKLFCNKLIFIQIVYKTKYHLHPYRRILCTKSNMTGATSGTGAANPSVALKFSLSF